MKKITLLLILNFSFLIFNSSAQAPAWLWAIGAGGVSSEQGNGVTTDASGNVLATGNFFSPSITFGATTLMLNGTQDIFIVKFDNSGNVLWAKREGGIISTYSNSIATDVNGNIFVTGMFGGTSITFGTTTLTNAAGGFYDMFIVKYDPSGNVLWAKKAGGSDWDEGKGVSTDASGNVFVTGQYKSSSIVFGATTLTNSGLVDVFTVKYDGSGNVLWAKKGGGSANGYGYGISADASGNAFITGSFASLIVFGTDTLTATGSPSIFTVKYDTSGNVLWAKSPTGGGYGLSIATDGGGNAAVTGWFGGPITFGSTTLTNAGGADVFIAKYDGSGNELWAKGGGGTSDDYGLGITTDATGNIIAAGGFLGPSITFGTTTLTNSGSGNNDLFVAKYDGSGNVLWATSANGTGNDAGAGVSTDASGDVFVTGSFNGAPITFGSTTLTNAGINDFFIAKLAGTVGVNEINGEGNTVSLFPDPAINELRIQNAEFRIESIDVSDVLVQKYNSIFNIQNSTLTIDVSTLSPAIYFVKVRGGKEERVAKFVKQ